MKRPFIINHFTTVIYCSLYGHDVVFDITNSNKDFLMEIQDIDRYAVELNNRGLSYLTNVKSGGKMIFSHYKWLECNIDIVFTRIFGKSARELGCSEIVSSHGDKCDQYRKYWDSLGIPFDHASMVYLLSYTDLYPSELCRSKVKEWVCSKYNDVKYLLPLSWLTVFAQ